MGRADAETLDEALARELAQREGLKAVLTGEVAPAGSGYVLTASLIAPATGEILTSERVSASGDDEVIGAIDELSKRLRERIGESLRTIRAEEPLEQVTTSDLEALRLYTEGAQLVEGNEYRRGIDLLEEAISRDPTFAMAYRKLGIELFNRFENRARALEALTSAYEYRDRLTPRERYLAEAAYFENVSSDEERVIGAYQNMLDLDPEDPWALNNLGGVYGNRADYAEAEVYFERAIEADSLSGLFAFTNTVFVQANQGKFHEAEVTLERAQRLYPGEWLVDQRWFLLPMARLDYDEGEARLAEVRERWTTPFLRDQGMSFAARVANVRGRLSQAERAMQEAERINVERGLPGEALGRALGMAWVDILLREDPDAALARVDQALDRHPLDEIPAADRPYVQLARLTALSGDVDGSRAWTDQFESELPEESRGVGERFMGLAEADRQLVTGAQDQAIELYSQMSDLCLRCGLALIGRAHLESNRSDSAIAVFTRLVETPDLFRVNSDAGELGPTYERLAHLHDEQGDLDEAAKYYAALVELWAEADEELQPRARAAQARLEEILREVG
jgi:tetratricopeptide (TPR) repeat protein